MPPRPVSATDSLDEAVNNFHHMATTLKGENGFFIFGIHIGWVFLLVTLSLVASRWGLLRSFVSLSWVEENLCFAITSSKSVRNRFFSKALIEKSHCVTRAPLWYFIRSWVALSFKVCQWGSQWVCKAQLSQLDRVFHNYCFLYVLEFSRPFQGK